MRGLVSPVPPCVSSFPKGRTSTGLLTKMSGEADTKVNETRDQEKDTSSARFRERVDAIRLCSMLSKDALTCQMEAVLPIVELIKAQPRLLLDMTLSVVQQSASHMPRAILAEMGLRYNPQDRSTHHPFFHNQVCIGAPFQCSSNHSITSHSAIVVFSQRT